MYQLTEVSWPCSRWNDLPRSRSPTGASPSRRRDTGPPLLSASHSCSKGYEIMDIQCIVVIMWDYDLPWSDKYVSINITQCSKWPCFTVSTWLKSGGIWLIWNICEQVYHKAFRKIMEWVLCNVYDVISHLMLTLGKVPSVEKSLTADLELTLYSSNFKGYLFCFLSVSGPCRVLSCTVTPRASATVCGS